MIGGTVRSRFSLPSAMAARSPFLPFFGVEIGVRCVDGRTHERVAVETPRAEARRVVALPAESGGGRLSPISGVVSPMGQRQDELVLRLARRAALTSVLAGSESGSKRACCPANGAGEEFSKVLRQNSRRWRPRMPAGVLVIGAVRRGDVAAHQGAQRSDGRAASARVDLPEPDGPVFDAERLAQRAPRRRRRPNEWVAPARRHDGDLLRGEARPWALAGSIRFSSPVRSRVASRRR